MAENKPKKQGCFARLTLALGCCLVYPLGIAMVLAGITLFFYADSIALLAKPPNLENIEGGGAIKQEALWSLQEKKLAQVGMHAPKLKLTLNEFNALLSEYRILPVGAFYLRRLRLSLSQDKPTLFIIGSGFFLKKLIIRLDLCLTGTSIQIGRVFINSFELKNIPFLRSWFLTYLKDSALKFKNELPARVILGTVSLSIKDNIICLTGDFMQNSSAEPQKEAAK